MRDPFNAPVDFIDADHRAGNELTRTNVTLSVRDYGLQNGDAKPFIPNSDTLVRNQLQGASLHNDLIAEDPNTRLMDPETKELYFRSRTQEEEILLLRKQIADASLKELQLLSEKHILERKLSDLRMAVDERQEDAISGALKQLSEKKNHLEENMRLGNDLKAEEEELYLFTSSLLGMLAEYNVRPPQIYASTITTVTKRLYQQMQWKIRSLNDSLGNIAQPGNIYNPNHQEATPSRNGPSSPYNVEPNRSTFPQYAQDPNDRHAEYQGSTYNQDIVATAPSNYFEENAGPREARIDEDSQFYRNDNQEYSADGDPLPGIEGFQIVGDPRPGSTLRACGFPTNGTTLCNFQWVRCLENGTRQSIEGATMYDFVVTADDVGTLLAVDCTPMDDNGRQGDLVREYANGGNKIACDPEMQNDINIYISKGRADFDVYVLVSRLPTMPVIPSVPWCDEMKGLIKQHPKVEADICLPLHSQGIHLMNGNKPRWCLDELGIKSTSAIRMKLELMRNIHQTYRQKYPMGELLSLF
ncbi:hypothetical protein BRADI_1g32732v3 [Brachypodium distachyon]|uniref:AIR9-like A9 domain-containing protein n=1 Tax=Brachypodium distachyon TaxID=15368 RepID=A0A0Q3RWF5_BRADI|nr:hypothetical protein BRADI_1g32732v3 [Brachypodium distachyon]